MPLNTLRSFSFSSSGAAFTFALWFANTLSDFEINDLAALPALFCYNS
jgi:hypothetical protein